LLDIHCHILPGVDDGSRNMKESVAMLHEAQRVGIDRIVCTPHCRASHFHPDRIAAAYRALQPRAAQLGIKLIQGYELHWRKLADIGVADAARYCFAGSDMLLLEFSSDTMPTNWQVVLNNLAREGIKVIIAHPERYEEVQKDHDIAVEMKNLGCMLQVSANFVEGGLFDKRRRCAIALMKEGLIDCVASDAHRPSDYATFAKALDVARKYM
jgi:protein-tyrosine phosphatase